MRDALHTILVADRFERRLDVLIAAVIAVVMFVMYATGGFSVGGVVVLPDHSIEVDPGTVLIEFSPLDEREKLMEAAEKNAAELAKEGTDAQ